MTGSLDFNDIKNIENTWSHLLIELRDAMDKGVQPDDKHVKKLASAWKALDESLSSGGLEVSEVIKNDHKAYEERISNYINKALKH